MLERSCHDDCVERAAFHPTVVAVAGLDAHIVITEVSHQFRSGLGEWRDNLNGTDLPRNHGRAISAAAALIDKTSRRIVPRSSAMALSVVVFTAIVSPSGSRPVAVLSSSAARRPGRAQ